MCLKEHWKEQDCIEHIIYNSYILEIGKIGLWQKVCGGELERVIVEIEIAGGKREIGLEKEVCPSYRFV